MKTYIHIVRGYYDDYECVHYWDVIAFTDSKVANDYATKANAENKILQDKKEKLIKSGKLDCFDRIRKLKNKFDKEMDGNHCSGYEVKAVLIGLNIQ